MPPPQNLRGAGISLEGQHSYRETLNGGATMRWQSSFRSDQAKEDLLMTNEEMQKAMKTTFNLIW
jgi:hypothetical protein